MGKDAGPAFKEWQTNGRELLHPGDVFVGDPVGFGHGRACVTGGHEHAIECVFQIDGGRAGGDQGGVSLGNIFSRRIFKEGLRHAECRRGADGASSTDGHVPDCFRGFPVVA